MNVILTAAHKDESTNDALLRKNDIPLNDVNKEDAEPGEERETWGRKIEFILTCVGYCVGLGNVWRFPYLVFNNGGGAFLIPYFLMLLLCGMPMFLMELALGQYFSLGPVSTWNATCPLAKGVGFAMIAVAFLCTIYYNVIIAWVLYYLYSSMQSEVPWKDCENKWNSKYCIQGRLSVNCSNASLASYVSNVGKNITSAINKTLICSKNTKTPSEEYWERHVLKISTSIDETGEIRAELIVCLIIAWAIIFFILFKGIASSGKVVYFTATFPYIVLFILLIRGVLLEGAGEGIKYFLKPDWTKLGKAEVWVAAATQIFYSLGIGFGSLIAFGSYNKFHNDVVRDAVSLAITNCVTSLLAGFVVFCVLGNMAFNTKTPIENVVSTGPGLVFVVYPEGLANMPISPLWGVLFFFMILTIGIDTQFAMMESVIVGFIDEYQKLKKHKMLFTLILCIIACIFGLSMVTQGGMYVFNLFNLQSGGISLLFLAFFEILAMGYGYGAENFEANIGTILGKKPFMYWRLCWKYFTPVIILSILLASLIQWEGISYDDYKYPVFAEFIGWCIALSSMIWIPGVAIFKIYNAEGQLMDRIKTLIRPDEKLLLKVERANKLDQSLTEETA